MNVTTGTALNQPIPFTILHAVMLGINFLSVIIIYQYVGLVEDKMRERFDDLFHRNKTLRWRIDDIEDRINLSDSEYSELTPATAVDVYKNDGPRKKEAKRLLSNLGGVMVKRVLDFSDDKSESSTPDKTTYFSKLTDCPIKFEDTVCKGSPANDFDCSSPATAVICDVDSAAVSFFCDKCSVAEIADREDLNRNFTMDYQDKQRVVLALFQKTADFGDMIEEL